LVQVQVWLLVQTTEKKIPSPCHPMTSNAQKESRYGCLEHLHPSQSFVTDSLSDRCRVLTLGRDPRCDIVLNCPQVARVQAKIYVHNAGVWVRDTAQMSGEPNLTLLNKKEIGLTAQLLRYGDIIEIFGRCFRFQAANDLDSEPTAQQDTDEEEPLSRLFRDLKSLFGPEFFDIMFERWCDAKKHRNPYSTSSTPQRKDYNWVPRDGLFSVVPFLWEDPITGALDIHFPLGSFMPKVPQMLKPEDSVYRDREPAPVFNVDKQAVVPYNRRTSTLKGKEEEEPARVKKIQFEATRNDNAEPLNQKESDDELPKKKGPIKTVRKARRGKENNQNHTTKFKEAEKGEGSVEMEGNDTPKRGTVKEIRKPKKVASRSAKKKQSPKVKEEEIVVKNVEEEGEESILNITGDDSEANTSENEEIENQKTKTKPRRVVTKKVPTRSITTRQTRRQSSVLVSPRSSNRSALFREIKQVGNVVDPFSPTKSISKNFKEEYQKRKAQGLFQQEGIVTRQMLRGSGAPQD